MLTRALVCLSTLLAASPALSLAGTETPYEVSGSANMSLFIPTRTGTSSSFLTSGGVGYQLRDEWQAAGKLAFFRTEGYTSLSLTVGPTFNFGGATLANSYYASAQGGFVFADAGSSSTNFAYVVAGGRRFALAENISWKPEVNLTGTSAGSDRPQINIVPIQISVFL